MDFVIIITSLLTGLFILIKVSSVIKKSNQRKREREQIEKQIEKERELISSVTSLSRGTETERLLILELLENETPPITIYHDLIVKKPNDKFSQIDLVLVMTEGIIVFEIKDYSGWLYGSGNTTNWTQVLSYGNEKFKFYNPIKQNKQHIIELKKTLKQFKNIPFFSVIVFYGDCELKEISYIPKNTYLVKPHRVMEVVHKIKEENEPTNYTNKREVVDKLKELVSMGENVDYQEQHIENINDMIGKNRIYD